MSCPFCGKAKVDGFLGRISECECVLYKRIEYPEDIWDEFSIWMKKKTMDWNFFHRVMLEWKTENDELRERVRKLEKVRND